MDAYLLFLLLGLGAGAAYALLGLGLVLEHRSSRLVNFAHGGLAMFSAYVYVELRDTGTLPLPIVGLPDPRISMQGLAVPTAMLATMLYAGVAGAAVYLLVFRPLRTASPLANVVASVGLMIVLQALAVLKFGTTPRVTGTILPGGTLTFGELAVPRDRLWMAGLAAAMGAVLTVVYRWTRFGLVTQALSENEKGAVLLGWSAHRIAAANWAVATMLAAVAGVLLVPIASLDPAHYTLYVIPALACLLVARMRSFVAVVSAGLALGMVQSVATKLQAEYPWLPQHGLREGIPFLVIIVALVLLGRRLPDLDALVGNAGAVLVSRSVPWWPAAAVSVAVAALALVVLEGGLRAAFIQSLVAALLCCSLVALTGYVGQISLAQLAFAGVGGFAFARAGSAWGLPLPASLALAGLAAVPLGLLIGIPAVRIRGVQLAVVTLGAAVVVEQFVFNDPRVTGGFFGVPVEPASMAGLDLDIRGDDPSAYPRAAFGFLVLVLVAATGCLLAHLRRTAAGRAMLAVKGNERAATALGIDVAAVKLGSFVVAAAIAGVAGAVIGLHQGTLSAESFGIFTALGLLAIAYIGGISRVTGAVIAGVVLAEGGLVPTILDRWIHFGQYLSLFVGAMLITAAIGNPTGIAGRIEAANARLRDRLHARRAGVRPRGEAASGPLPAGRRAGRAPLDAPVLSVAGLSVHRGGVLAVDSLSLTVPRGTIVGLIGPNGAGKTTFIDAIGGFLPITAGQIRLLGVDLTTLPAYRRARAGLGRTFQSVELFEELTVADNIRAAVDGRGASGATRAARVRWALDLLGLSNLDRRAPGELSNGQRKLVGVARAIAGGPNLVLLDEPAAGLDTAESRDFGDRLRRVREAGMAVLLVDHDMSLVLDVCDTIYVLDFGRLVANGTPDAIRQDPAVLASYLGQETSQPGSVSPDQQTPDSMGVPT